MEPSAHLQILKRTGSVLLTIGLIDIAVMVYCIVNRISYSSSFNIFGVIAGVFLLRGSLRAATIVRWFTVFSLASSVALIVALPFLQPVGLTLTEVRLGGPLYILAQLGFMTGAFALLFWLNHQLSRAPIQAAQAAMGRKAHDMRIPAAAGIGLVVIIAIVMSVVGSGDTAAKAKLLAEHQLCANYEYHLSSFKQFTNDKGSGVTAVVTAWNEEEVRNVSVKWEDH